MNKDQASSLREAFSNQEVQGEQKFLRSARAISFTSGKGGVGKTNTVVNLAIQLARLGRKVFLVDADLGLANIDIILNISPQYTIEDVLTGKRHIDDVIIEGPEGIHILPASSGLSEMSELTKEQQMSMLKALSPLQSKYDYFLIDTGAGIASNVLRFNASVDEICVVTNTEPTSITDAYALMKIMSTKYQVRQFNLIVNQVSGLQEAKNVHQRLVAVFNQFLPIRLVLIGFIPRDPNFINSVRKQIPMSLYMPNSATTKAYKIMARHIDSNPGQDIEDEENISFWHKLGLWKRM